MNIHPHQAEIYLAGLIKGSQYYKNYTKYSKINEVFLKKLCVIEIFHFDISI